MGFPWPFRSHDAFLSHSWKDKPLARRIARRLSQRGVRVWIDEEELTAGQQLPERLKREIARSRGLAVVCTKHGLQSEWVGKEIEFAEGLGTPIIPLICEDDLEAQLLKKYTGIAFRDVFLFERKIDELAMLLIGRRASRSRKSSRLEDDLGRLLQEAPHLASIQDLVQEDLTVNSAMIESLGSDDHHDAECLLATLYDLLPRRRWRVAQLAAQMLATCGAGAGVLWVYFEDNRQDDHRAIFYGLLRDDEYDEPLIGYILRLAERAPKSSFYCVQDAIHKSYPAFSEPSRRMCLSLIVTKAERPGDYAVDLAYALFGREPEHTGLKRLWLDWVGLGFFDRFATVPGGVGPNAPFVLLNMIEQSLTEGFQAFEQVAEAYNGRLRGLLRSHDPADLRCAGGIVEDAFRTEGRFPHGTYKKTIAQTIFRCLGSSEWETSPFGKRLFGPFNNAGLYFSGVAIDFPFEELRSSLESLPASKAKR